MDEKKMSEEEGMETERRRSVRISNLEEKQELEKESKTSKKLNLKTKSHSNDNKSKKQKGKVPKLKLRPLHEMSSLAKEMHSIETKSSRKSGNTSSQKSSSQKMPEKHILEFLLDLLQRKDRFRLFADPVNPGEVEAYYAIVKKPMDFSTIRTKLDAGNYTNLDQFENDVFLICRNTRNFTPSNTVHNREVGQSSPSNLQATQLCEYATKIFQTLRSDIDTFKLAYSLSRRRSASENPSHANHPLHDFSNFLQGSDGNKDSDYPHVKGKAKINADDVALKFLRHNNERSEYKESLLRPAKEAAAAAAYRWKLQPAFLPVPSKQVQAGMAVASDKQVGNYMDMQNDMIKENPFCCTSDNEYFAPLPLNDQVNSIQGTAENEPIFSDLMAATLKWSTGNWMSYPNYQPNYGMGMMNSPESDIMVWPTRVISDLTQSRMQPEMNAVNDLGWSSSRFPSLGSCSLIPQQKAVPVPAVPAPDYGLPTLPPHLKIVQVTQEVPDHALLPLPSRLQIIQAGDPTWVPPLSQGQSSLRPAEMESRFQAQFPVNQNMGTMKQSVGDGQYSRAMPCKFNSDFHTANASEVSSLPRPAEMDGRFQAQFPVNQNMGTMKQSAGDGQYSSARPCQFNSDFHTANASAGSSLRPAEMDSRFQAQFPVNQNIGTMKQSVGDGQYSSAMPNKFNSDFHTVNASEVSSLPWIQTPECHGSAFCMPVEIDIWGRNKPPQQEIDQMALSCEMDLVNETGSTDYGLDNQGLEALITPYS